MRMRFALALALVPSLLAAQAPVQATNVAGSVVLFSTPAGNVAAAIASDGAFIIGPLSVASTPAIQAEIARRTQSPVRYVVAGPRDPARAEGDGGWGRLGALVFAQEAGFGRLGDSSSLTGGALPPKAAFSQFLRIVLAGEDVHAVHQQPGYTDGDVLVHFENSSVVYLGESLAGDGYPMIDSAHGGTLEGLLRTINPWTRGRNRIIPARGPALAPSDVAAFRDMVVAVRDRVHALRGQGQTVDQVVAARPTAEYDARWGQGRVTPEAFVRSVYAAVR